MVVWWVVWWRVGLGYSSGSCALIGVCMLDGVVGRDGGLVGGVVEGRVGI